MASNKKSGNRIILGLLILVFSIIAPLTAQASNYSNSTLDNILAPIALYPDSLLGDVLAASTYPDQLIEADTWAAQHDYQDATSTLNSVKNKNWDDSVKALLLTPDVIAMMVNDLTWTDKLAQAFTTQQSALCDSIQRLRRRAKDNGALESTDQVKIIEQNGVISIGSAQSDVIVVPQYSTTVCTQKLDPAKTILNTALVWGTVRTLDAIFFGSYWDWNSHNVYIGPGYNHYYWNGSPRPWYNHPPVPPPGRPDPRHPGNPYKPAFHPGHNPPPPGYVSHQKKYQDRRPGFVPKPVTDNNRRPPQNRVTAAPAPNQPKTKGNPNYRTPNRQIGNVHSQQNIKQPNRERPNFDKNSQPRQNVRPSEPQRNNEQRTVRQQPQRNNEQRTVRQQPQRNNEQRAVRQQPQRNNEQRAVRQQPQRNSNQSTVRQQPQRQTRVNPEPSNNKERKNRSSKRRS